MRSPSDRFQPAGQEENCHAVENEKQAAHPPGKKQPHAVKKRGTTRGAKENLHGVENKKAPSHPRHRQNNSLTH
jgi:hypothetical protein